MKHKLEPWLPDGVLEVVLFAEEGQCVAQCLQKDVCAQGASPGEALERLGSTLDMQHHLPGWEAVPVTPKRYWDMRDHRFLWLQRPPT
jgi:hypothetical protein